ncbi:Protein low PSII accumulation 3, chloroplastic [Vitis vinifera]|uniref:Protein low PSII accumulation 3, chloroplastic n=1 Tax=Vitis vinifera TaxID=29760 RepID=A0A438JWS9_VITVI|nr:Protein low PSII accumulation 3, chloroplastic [Vitis vinifera]
MRGHQRGPQLRHPTLHRSGWFKGWMIIWISPLFSFQIDGISIGSLDDVPSGPVATFFRSIRDTLDFDFEDDNEGLFYCLMMQTESRRTKNKNLSVMCTKLPQWDT